MTDSDYSGFGAKKSLENDENVRGSLGHRWRPGSAGSELDSIAIARRAARMWLDPASASNTHIKRERERDRETERQSMSVLTDS